VIGRSSGRRTLKYLMCIIGVLLGARRCIWWRRRRASVVIVMQMRMLVVSVALVGQFDIDGGTEVASVHCVESLE
jgi:hypothetical protein